MIRAVVLFAVVGLALAGRMPETIKEEELAKSLYGGKPEISEAKKAEILAGVTTPEFIEKVEQVKARAPGLWAKAAAIFKIGTPAYEKKPLATKFRSSKFAVRQHKTPLSGVTTPEHIMEKNAAEAEKPTLGGVTTPEYIMEKNAAEAENKPLKPTLGGVTTPEYIMEKNAAEAAENKPLKPTLGGVTTPEYIMEKNAAAAAEKKPLEKPLKVVNFRPSHSPYRPRNAADKAKPQTTNMKTLLGGDGKGVPEIVRNGCYASIRKMKGYCAKLVAEAEQNAAASNELGAQDKVTSTREGCDKKVKALIAGCRARPNTLPKAADIAA